MLTLASHLTFVVVTQAVSNHASWREESVRCALLGLQHLIQSRQPWPKIMDKAVLASSQVVTGDRHPSM